MDSICSTIPNKKGEVTEVFIQQNHKTEYDKQTVIDVVGLEKCVKLGLVKLNDKAVERYMKAHPEIKEKIEEDLLAKSVSYTKPYLASKKTKGGSKK